MKFRSIFKALAVGSIVAVGAHAQAVWIGLGGDTNWTTSGNWTPSLPPNNGTDITVFSGISSFTSTVNANWSLSTLTVASTAGTLTLNNSGGSTLTIGSGFFYGGLANVAVNVPIAGAGNFWLNGGTGTVTLTAPSPGANTFSGTTQISLGGTLTDGADYSFSPNSDLYVGGGGSPGTVHVNFNEMVSDIGDVSGGNGLITIAGGKTLYINSGYTNTYTGTISGAGNLEKDGSSTQILAGTSSYTGTTTIGAGAAIQLGNGTSGGSFASSGVSGTGDLSFELPVGSPLTYSGNLTGGLHVDQQGPGTVTLSGTNTYSAATTINGGTLAAGSTSAFGGAMGLSAVTINGSGTLALSTFSNTIGSLQSASASSVVTIGTGATLTIGNPSANTTFGGVISGPGAITINTGGGSQGFGGANNYSGVTTMQSGEYRLQLDLRGCARKHHVGPDWHQHPHLHGRRGNVVDRQQHHARERDQPERLQPRQRRRHHESRPHGPHLRHRGQHHVVHGQHTRARERQRVHGHRRHA